MKNRIDFIKDCIKKGKYKFNPHQPSYLFELDDTKVLVLKSINKVEFENVEKLLKVGDK